jgi:hypothetical protein
MNAKIQSFFEISVWWFSKESSFPCLRAVALQRAGVKTGIQRISKYLKDWIPAGVYPVLDTGQE